jgi:hypothetical protein
MKNRTGYILLIAAGLFSMSVLSAAPVSFKATFVVVEDHAFDISKIEPVHPVILHNYDMGTVETGGIGFARSYTTLEYVNGKVINKALPLCRKLWLMNCQIALK